MALKSNLLSIRVSPIQESEIRQTLSGVKNGAIRAIVVGINRTAKKLNTRIIQNVTGITKLKRKAVNRRIVAHKATFENPSATITVLNTPIPAINFPNHKMGQRGGVRVQYFQNKGAFVLKHAFISTVKSAQQKQLEGFEGHKGIFLRSKHLPTKGPNVGNKKLKLTKTGYAGRFAIEEVMGPNLVGLVSFPEVLQKIEFDATEDLKKQIESQADRLLNRRKIDRE